MLTHLHVYIQHISLFIDPDMDNRDDLIRVPEGLHGFIREVVELIRIEHGGRSQMTSFLFYPSLLLDIHTQTPPPPLPHRYDVIYGRPPAKSYKELTRN